MADPQVDLHDPAYQDLARELYWAQDAAARARLGTGELRDRLHEMALRLRSDETLIIPHGEPNLASTSKLRRRVKYAMWRFVRPVSWRYDRLLADQAELTIGLAEQLMAAEAEIARLRARLDAVVPEAQSPGPSPSAVEPAEPSP
jgi:hypothetical protein